MAKVDLIATVHQPDINLERAIFRVVLVAKAELIAIVLVDINLERAIFRVEFMAKVKVEQTAIVLGD